MCSSVTNDLMDLIWPGKGHSLHTDKRIRIIFTITITTTDVMVYSLLKCYLQIRGYQVFIDVAHLKNGKFGDNLLRNVKKAKNFVLVLTKSSLDRCVGDHECKDWIHKVTAHIMTSHSSSIKCFHA